MLMVHNQNSTIWTSWLNNSGLCDRQNTKETSRVMKDLKPKVGMLGITVVSVSPFE